jgi:hypothetical protein
MPRHGFLNLGNSQRECLKSTIGANATMKIREIRPSARFAFQNRQFVKRLFEMTINAEAGEAGRTGEGRVNPP